MNEYKNIDEYIANFSDEVQEILQKIREIIQQASPEAKEKISYGIPTFTLNGKNLIHFGGYDKFISLYPGAAGTAAFEDKLKDYKTSKGTVQFQLNEPIPYDLVQEIAEFCVAQRKNK